jgi:transcriptional regulator with XRE-family HTH domain
MKGSMAFGKFLRKRRLMMGIRTQKELARRAGLHYNTICQLEKADDIPPTLRPSSLLALAITLGFETPDAFVTAYRTGDMGIPPGQEHLTDVMRQWLTDHPKEAVRLDSNDLAELANTTGADGGPLVYEGVGERVSEILGFKDLVQRIWTIHAGPGRQLLLDTINAIDKHLLVVSPEPSKK